MTSCGSLQYDIQDYILNFRELECENDVEIRRTFCRNSDCRRNLK